MLVVHSFVIVVIGTISCSIFVKHGKVVSYTGLFRNCLGTRNSLKGYIKIKFTISLHCNNRIKIKISRLRNVWNIRYRTCIFSQSFYHFVSSNLNEIPFEQHP